MQVLSGDVRFVNVVANIITTRFTGEERLAHSLPSHSLDVDPSTGD